MLFVQRLVRGVRHAAPLAHDGVVEEGFYFLVQHTVVSFQCQSCWQWPKRAMSVKACAPQSEAQMLISGMS